MCGDKDADGFYRGECAGKAGYIPCNMVSEVQVENNDMKKQLLKQGYIPPGTSMESVGTVPPFHACSVSANTWSIRFFVDIQEAQNCCHVLCCRCTPSVSCSY